MSSNKYEEIKLDVPLVHSPAQLCHIDSLAMILRYIGDEYEPWYLGGVSGRFFGFGYFPSSSFVRIGLGTYPLEAILTFLKEHGYSFKFNEGENWSKAFVILRKYLNEGLPVLVICHMGWLSYNKEYEIFRRIEGVVDHYVIVTGFKDNKFVFINDPNPELFKKDAKLSVEDFRIAWYKKLKAIQSMSCPMIVVKKRKYKPEQKKILAKALRRAIKQMDTQKGPTGLAGLRMASIEIPKLLREDSVAITNSIPEYAFFTFRVAATEARYASKFLSYVSNELNILQIKLSAANLLIASECFADVRNLFMDCVKEKAKIVDIAEEVGMLLDKVYRAERDCYANLGCV